MSEWIIYTIGFTAQLLFSARLLMQWILSEKHRQVLTPASFWTSSLLASFLLFVYGSLRNDFAIMLGQSITYFIYIRNLQLAGDWKKINSILRIFILAFPLLIVTYYLNNNKVDMHVLLHPKNISLGLLCLGITGQLIFTCRFILQWIYAERTKEAVLPPAFWYYSLAGSSLIILYAILRLDPVLLIGQLTGLIVYSRNIILLKRYAN
jgi:lipid-A-disaccharide synthase-like uncharacterized protein